MPQRDRDRDPAVGDGGSWHPQRGSVKAFALCTKMTCFDAFGGPGPRAYLHVITS